MILSLSIHRGELTNSSPSTLSLCDSPPSPKMSAKAAINKAVFTPHDEKMLAAVQVKRRTKKKIPFLATGGQGDYMTFICLSGTTTSSTFLFPFLLLAFPSPPFLSYPFLPSGFLLYSVFPFMCLLSILITTAITGPLASVLMMTCSTLTGFMAVACGHNVPSSDKLPEGSGVCLCIFVWMCVAGLSRVCCARHAQSSYPQCQSY